MNYNNTENYIKYEESDLYILSMCIYPSGSLHVGHLRGLSYVKTLERYYSITGKKVFSALGWDALGLPAEIAAEQKNISPKEWTENNIKNMEQDLLNYEFFFDSRNSINTMEKKFYNMDQYIFILMFNNNLVYKYKKYMPFCEICNTVLSREQSMNDQCWRCKNKVLQKETEQYFIKIKQYAFELYNSIDSLNWPDKVKQIQKNWLGDLFATFKLKNNKYLNINFNEVSSNIKDIELYRENKKYYILEKQIKKNIISDTFIEEKFIPKIEDWCISRQRSWGTPIPLIECINCGLKVNKKTDFSIPNFPISINSIEYRKTICDKCNSIALKVPHTLDTFFSSSWYMYRHTDPNNLNIPFKYKDIQVDIYTGGIEHAAMHLIYARFFHKFLRDIKILNSSEPFKNFVANGLILSKTLFCKYCNEYVLDENFCNHEKDITYEKMSKSKKNGVPLENLYKKFNAEIIKTYILFAAPYDKDFIWIEKDIIGIERFFLKIKEYSLGNFISKSNEFKSKQLLEDYIKKNYELLDKLIYHNSTNWNVYISNLIKIFNLLKDNYYLDLHTQIFYLFMYIIAPNLIYGILKKIPVWIDNPFKRNNFRLINLFINNKFIDKLEINNMDNIKEIVSLYIKKHLDINYKEIDNIFISNNAINIIYKKK